MKTLAYILLCLGLLPVFLILIPVLLSADDLIALALGVSIFFGVLAVVFYNLIGQLK